MDKNIIISTKTVLITLTLVGFIWLLVQVKFILLSLFIAVILALGFEPAVRWFRKRGLPKALAILLIFLIILSLLVFLLAAGVPLVVQQTTRLLTQLPVLLDSIVRLPGIENYLDSLAQALTTQATSVPGAVVRVGVGAFSSVFTVVTILFFTAYILADFDKLHDTVLSLFAPADHGGLEKLILEIEQQVGSWLRGQFILCTIVGLGTYAGLRLLRVEYAMPLAIVAGFLEILPNLGPLISMIPALIVGFSQSAITGLGVVALFTLVQQLENNLIVPKVMRMVVGLHPLVTMVAILSGAKLFGLLGALMAVPITLVLITTVRYWLSKT